METISIKSAQGMSDTAFMKGTEAGYIQALEDIQLKISEGATTQQINIWIQEQFKEMGLA